MDKLKLAETIQRFYTLYQLQVNGGISYKSTIFQFQTEADLRLSFARQKKEFNQRSKESHSFMWFPRAALTIFASVPFRFDLSNLSGFDSGSIEAENELSGKKYLSKQSKIFDQIVKYICLN